MSYYNKPTKKSIVFNDDNQIGQTDLNKSTTVSDLEEYVKSDVPVFNNNILIKNGFSLQINNQTQNRAFTDELDNIINDTKIKTSNMSFTNNITNISGNINIPDNSLTYSKISGLDNKINKFDAYNSTIQKIEKDITA